MDVEFTDHLMSLVETERASETGLPVLVIQDVRFRLNIIRAAPDVGTLRRWKSLGYHQSSQGEGFVDLDGGWRFDVKLDSKRSPPIAVVSRVSQRTLALGTPR